MNGTGVKTEMDYQKRGKHLRSTNIHGKSWKTGAGPLPVRSRDWIYMFAIAAQQMKEMFSGCTKLQYIDLNSNKFVTSQETNTLERMFYNCQNLISLDLSGFHESRVTKTTSMFENCISLESLSMQNFLAYDVDNSDSMFKNCKSLISLDLSSFEGCMVYMQNMFQGCTALKEIKIPNIITESSLSLAGLFAGCESLTSANLSHFDTSLVTDFNDIFLNCSKLQSIDFGDEKHWDTAEGNYMRSMFEGCHDLKSLSIKKFKTDKVTIMNNMFKGCASLEELEMRELDLSSFDTRKVASWTDIWKDITELNITIDYEKNKNILDGRPDGIVINDIE